MRRPGKTFYQAHELAALAGVTVRTLHHYDRLGLLSPSSRSPAGYRLYREGDIARLQQILTLKFIGVPLKQIKELIDRGPLDLAATLRLQRGIIEQRRAELELALRAIDEAERQAVTGGAPDWQAFRQIIEVITMQKEMDWAKRYYSDEQLAELGKRWSPEVQRQADHDWSTLIADVEAALGEDPGSERAQALAERWASLIGGFTGGDPDIEAGLKRFYADEANWPASFKKPYSDEVGSFIQKAMAIHRQRSGS